MNIEDILEKIIKNRTVALIGPDNYVNTNLSKEHGKKIDKHNVVFKLNMGKTTSTMEQYYGTKCNLIISDLTNNNDYFSYKNFFEQLNNDTIIINPIPINNSDILNKFKNTITSKKIIYGNISKNKYNKINDFINRIIRNRNHSISILAILLINSYQPKKIYISGINLDQGTIFNNNYDGYYSISNEKLNHENNIVSFNEYDIKILNFLIENKIINTDEYLKSQIKNKMSNILKKEIIMCNNYNLQYRFDLGAKYYYLDCYYRNIKCNFYKEVYEKLMISFNGCWEWPGTKTKIEDFFESYEKLIDNFIKNGFNKECAIPMGINNIIYNGAHRLVLCKYFNIEPIFKKDNNNGSKSYDYNYFLKGSKGHPPLDRKYADVVALNNLELFKNNKNIRIVIIHSVANKMNKTIQVENILNKNGKIMYKKEITLSEKGYLNLVIELYRGEPYIGGNFQSSLSNGFGKKKACYANYPLVYYMYYLNKPEEDLNIKESIRKIYNIGKHSIHISDHYHDTYRVSCALLNENSIHFLNNGTNYISKNSQNYLNSYFDIVNCDNDFCVTSSIVLELYGLRNANDVDYLVLEDRKSEERVNKLKSKGISAHNGKWLTFYSKDNHNLLYDPNNYFYFNGHKFLSLKNIKEMKENRNEKKDIKDNNLIIKIL